MKSPTQLLLFFFCICFADLCHSQEEKFAGPFRVVVRQIEQCDDSGTRQIYVTSTRINKVSRTKYLFSTNVTFLIPLDDEIAVELEVGKFGNGGWRPHFLETEFPHFCSSLKEVVPVFFNAIMRAMRTECPVQPGTHELIDLDLADFKIGPSFPILPYGKYKFDFSARLNGSRVGCIRHYIDVVPAKKAPKQKKPRNGQ